ncbi:2Fe-2S iron-sulfur cluster-binding protein [Pedobacter gandavensis]|uniref:2Fe-2S iron-sulfur cluster-binding protein n=1 Tax=Pedobacter gandavensis TaxID=2679963 RepID=UPI002478A2FD|nr:2Fe-2S iron-sulfur cluster-binding protein [Pedobacter gandavensis]WGQ09695.1 2Fe-2S iron-sulfur cluster-binding protein [Pedobacter gandavensis]
MNSGNNIGLKIITLTVLWDEGSYEIETFANEYRSLMTLIFDRIGPEDFGECLGMGKCGTCLVEIIQNHTLTDFGRNECNTLNKHGISDPGMRLACQLLIDEHCNGMIVRLL